MKIKIPKSNNKRALILVDLQNGFVKKEKDRIVKNLEVLLKQEKYDLYVEATFEAKKGSLWDVQTHWTFPHEPTLPEIVKLLKDKKVIQVNKETRSTFKGDKDLTNIFNKANIQEVHIVGFDTSDCVFATAQESFDNGFFTYVIEECTGSSAGVSFHKKAISLLRHLNLTNHSFL